MHVCIVVLAYYNTIILGHTRIFLPSVGHQTLRVGAWCIEIVIERGDKASRLEHMDAHRLHSTRSQMPPQEVDLPFHDKVR